MKFLARDDAKCLYTLSLAGQKVGAPSRRLLQSAIMRYLLVCLWGLALGAGLAANADEPIVQMMLPGFTVQELPVHLSNVNNLRFAPDGRLFTLAYDGHIHISHDSDGDGLEETDQLFWDKPGLSVPVG